MTLPRRCCLRLATRVRRGAALALCLAACGPAWAGRPLNTDDAAILPTGACQLQAWLRPSRHLDEFVLQPACNPRGAVEWDASLAMARAPGGASSTSLGLQAKTAFRTVEPGSRGAGASLGVSRQAGDGAAQTTRAGNLIFSLAPSQALVVLHFNAGARQTASRHAVAGWGAAVEVELAQGWTLVAESYGERHAGPGRQLGLRTWLRPQRLQLDATLGQEPLDGRREAFATVGLVWFWDQVLPPRPAR
jgi:hypothetical protein